MRIVLVAAYPLQTQNDCEPSQSIASHRCFVEEEEEEENLFVNQINTVQNVSEADWLRVGRQYRRDLSRDLVCLYFVTIFFILRQKQ